ncbi:hypothetical protein VB715_15625 [Crocosphaera sp. UHCC 0190]|uniref:hypothetical protein n=1 Tax=Crocosphaera sp. UHCC 0190 TaxID=3110246 RepID=UPI002B1FE1C3|nr:hypothetical protein [Crocosphaera sp. UHCC 0190]MEA5511203.1 hypothetical protein [Crocosphaera sp. UHCC 0190]
MPTNHRRPVSLSLMSTDLPILSTIETAATLYQKDRCQFHLLLNQPEAMKSVADEEPTSALETARQLLWLELSPARVIMTLQGNGKFCYRHFWEPGIYGVSRYWLNDDSGDISNAFRLRNYTRSLKLEGDVLPEYLRLEYELWSGKVQLGNYILHLDIHH